MSPDSEDVQEVHEEREIRAGRSQALFRSINQKMQTASGTPASAGDRFAIACECADTTCLEMIDISTEEYEAVRRNPRRFAVLPGHIYPDVERIVGEFDRYTVVEKTAEAAVVAEQTATRE